MIWCRTILRAWAVPIAALAAVHTSVVAVVAWYVAEAFWGSLSVTVSPVPLPSAAFRGAWTAGAVTLALLALFVGPAATSGRRDGSLRAATPTAPATARVVRGSIATSLVLALAATSALPIYLALAAFGAVRAADLGGAVLTHLVTIVLGPVLPATFAVNVR